MNPFIISEDFILQADKQLVFFQEIQAQNSNDKLQLIHCNAPLEAERLIQNALSLAIAGNCSVAPLEAWANFYIQRIEALFNPLRSNSLILDFQVIIRSLNQQLQAICLAQKASAEEQESILLFNHLANELIVSALFKEARIPVAFYYLDPQKQVYSEKELYRMYADFEIFKSIQSDCVIFLQGRSFKHVA